MDEEYLNYDQAASYLGVHRSRIYQLVAEKRIGRTIAGFLVFTRGELDEYKAQKKKAGRPKGTRTRKIHEGPYAVTTS